MTAAPMTAVAVGTTKWFALKSERAATATTTYDSYRLTRFVLQRATPTSGGARTSAPTAHIRCAVHMSSGASHRNVSGGPFCKSRAPQLMKRGKQWRIATDGVPRERQEREPHASLAPLAPFDPPAHCLTVDFDRYRAVD